MYHIRHEKRVVTDDLPSLPKSAHELIKKAIHARLAVAPHDYGKPLRRSLAGHRRLRVSDYRIIYRIDEPAKIVYIVAIGHRKDIYDDA